MGREWIAHAAVRACERDRAADCQNATWGEIFERAVDHLLRSLHPQNQKVRKEMQKTKNLQINQYLTVAF